MELKQLFMGTFIRKVSNPTVQTEGIKIIKELKALEYQTAYTEERAKRTEESMINFINKWTA
jgi:hypothetical protein